MENTHNPLVSYELASKINDLLTYSWPVEYMINSEGKVIAENLVTQDRAEWLPCPSLDMAVRFLIEEIGIIVEPIYEYFLEKIHRQWRYRVIWFGDNYPTVYGPCLESRDAAISEGIRKALEQIEYERNRD